VEHKILLKSYKDYLAIKEADKELILYAVGNDALAPLKKQYIGFGDSTVLSIIDHQCLKTATKMTTVQKYEYKTTGYNNLGTQPQASLHISHSSIGSRCHLGIAAL
jgi:hypothetical protein